MLSKTWKNEKDRKDKMKEKDKLNAKKGKLGMSEIGYESEFVLEL